MRVALLTVSDRGASGDYEDRSGPILASIVQKNTPWQVSHRAVVADEQAEIAATLIGWCDAGIHLILTSGGTGFSPRDVTPEATKAVIEREAPGIAEALRVESLKITRHAMLSRGVAGIRGNTLIINMPGNPKAVRENMAVLLPILPHALALLTNSPHSEQQHRQI
ncbi:MAG: MogA/MoaB family molybdenum cofactor biosynthesis protein [Chloroflexi bacterium]|nr:MogA/MoaB family molybdenum cofactor biosynthesis protein [Chloroflexota bacterium]